MSIANTIDEPDALRNLRIQAITFDDRNSLNWILSGKARVAILPLVRCFSSLIRDPRLSVVLPDQGAPLHWTVLVRPKQTRQSFPGEWLEAAWEMPHIARLLSKAWIPPIPYSDLIKDMHFVPDSYKSIILPAKSVWNNCWSFPLITEQETNRLESLWIQSTP